MGSEDLKTRVSDLERELKRLQERMARIASNQSRQTSEVRKLSTEMETRIKREEIMMEALGVDASTRKGERGILGDLDKSILRLEEYLLKTSERIENILTMLKEHREFLVRVNKRISKTENRDTMRMDLDIMKNTLTILAMAGIEFDASLVAEINEIKRSLGDSKANLDEIGKRKSALSKKFDEELKRYDLESIFVKKKNIPGYV